MLKPQDVLILLRLAGEPTTWTYEQLAIELGMSASEVHQGLKRAEKSGLYHAQGRKVMQHALFEFIRYGLRYVFPATPLPRSQGMQTGHSAKPLCDHIWAGADDVLVWPHPDGERVGEAIAPLYRSAPDAAAKNPTLYRRLALIDALRAGRVRERKLASDLLKEELRA